MIVMQCACVGGWILLYCCGESDVCGEFVRLHYNYRIYHMADMAWQSTGCFIIDTLLSSSVLFAVALKSVAS